MGLMVERKKEIFRRKVTLKNTLIILNTCKKLDTENNYSLYRAFIIKKYYTPIIFNQINYI